MVKGLMKLIFLVLLISISHQRRTTKVQPIYKTHDLKNQTLELGQDQDFIYYFDNPYIFDVDVYSLVNGVEYLSESLVVEHNGVKQDIGIFDGRSNCYPYKRQLVIEDKITLTLYEDTQTNYMSDILVVPQFNATYVVTDTFKVHEVRFVYAENEIQEVSVNKKSLDDIDLRKILQRDNPAPISPDKAKFAYSKGSKYPIVFTKYGAVVLEIDPIKPLKIQSFIQTIPRDTILDVHVIKDLMFVALGKQGIDVYSYQDGNLDYQTSFNQSHVGSLREFNIIDVSSDQENKYLIVLDLNFGLYFMDISDSYKILFNIYFPRVKAFSHYLNTYIVIAETVNGIEYVAELFVDIPKMEFYFNRIYIEDTSFYHIEMTQFYAVLISEDDHIVIEHSLYNEFIPKISEIVTSFQEEDLITFVKYAEKKSEVVNPNSDTDYYVGLSKGDIKVFEVNQQSSGILCTFGVKDTYDYKILLNSTRCLPDDTQSSPYELCQLKQYLKIVVDKATLESDQAFLIGIIVVSAFFIILILCMLNCIFSNKWKNQLISLRGKVSEAKKYKEFQEIEASSMMVGHQPKRNQYNKDDDNL